MIKYSEKESLLLDLVIDICIIISEVIFICQDQKYKIVKRQVRQNFKFTKPRVHITFVY